MSPRPGSDALGEAQLNAERQANRPQGDSATRSNSLSDEVMARCWPCCNKSPAITK